MLSRSRTRYLRTESSGNASTICSKEESTHGFPPEDSHGGVVVGVASAAHAADDAVRGEHPVIILAGVRAALIRIEARVGVRPWNVQRADCNAGPPARSARTLYVRTRRIAVVPEPGTPRLV